MRGMARRIAGLNLGRWTGLATAVAVIGLAAGAPPAQAQTASGALDDFNLTSWTEANGLPPGRIRDLTQDAAGYLWIASDSGVVRFDGLSFELWNARFTPAIPSGPAGALLSTSDGSLWMGLSGKTPVGRIHGGQITLFGAPEGLAPSYTRSLVQDHAGVMWAATSSGLYRFESGRWHRVGAADGLPEGATLAVFEDSARRLWVGTTSAIYRRAAPGRPSSESTSSTCRATCGRTSARTRTAACSRAISPRASACPGARGRHRRVADGAQRCGTTGAVTSGWGRWGKASGVCAVTARAIGRGARPRSPRV